MRRSSLFLFPLVVAFLSTTSCWAAPRPAGSGNNGGLGGPVFIEIPIDHFGDSNSWRYKNRYWVNDTYYEPGGPVFLFCAGEQDAEPLLPYHLQEYHGLSATMRLANRYRGFAVLWEHRFYGASLPFPLNENTTATQWNYLSIEQALEDVVFFANSFSRKWDTGHRALHPSVTPWIWIGASYPAARGAMLRLRNPEVVFAVWASSAAPQAQVNMPSFYGAIERSMTLNCSADWIAITKYVDGVLGSANASLKIDIKFALRKALLSMPGGNTTGARGLTREQAAKIDDVTAGQMLLNPLQHFQYFGFQASVLPFCNLLETKNFTTHALDSGISAATGVQSAFDAFVIAVSESDSDLDDPPPYGKPWMWQYCSEWGQYLIGDPTNPRSIETSFRSREWYQANCNSSFPEGSLPPSPAVDHVLKYGGWNMNPSNVFFTNGEFDPWRTLSLASIEPNAPHRQPTTAIPDCNVPPPENTFFGMTHADMVHSPDTRVLLIMDANHTNFRTVGYHSPVSPDPFYAALDLFQRSLDQWLPCFKPAGQSRLDAIRGPFNGPNQYPLFGRL